MIIGAFYSGFIGMSWYLGTFRDRFESSKEYNTHMFINFGACLVITCYCIVN